MKSLVGYLAESFRYSKTSVRCVFYELVLAAIDLMIVPWGVVTFIPSIAKSLIYSRVQLKQSRVLDRLQFKHGRIYNMFFEIAFGQEVKIFHAFQYIRKKWEAAIKNVYAQKLKMTKTEAPLMEHAWSFR